MSQRERTQWNRDASRAKEEARRLFVGLAWPALPARLLNGACSAWFQREDAAGQGGASGAVTASAGAAPDSSGSPDQDSSDETSELEVLLATKEIGFPTEHELPACYAKIARPDGPGKVEPYGLIWLGPWPVPEPTLATASMSKSCGRYHSHLWATPVDMEGSPADHWYFKQCRLGPDEGRSL